LGRLRLSQLQVFVRDRLKTSRLERLDLIFPIEVADAPLIEGSGRFIGWNVTIERLTAVIVAATFTEKILSGALNFVLAQSFEGYIWRTWTILRRLLWRTGSGAGHRRFLLGTWFICG